MKVAQKREKAAVDCGYWHLFRFNPALTAQGVNPFVLDSKEPSADFFEFLKAEVRYNSLYKKYDAEVVDALFNRCYDDSRTRYASYKKMAADIDV